MHFGSIHTQLHTADLLKRLIRQDRISHAQLFAGREGSPNLQFALAFANALVCENPIDGDACMQCAACHKSTKMVHPDIHYAFPVVKKDKKTISEHFLAEFRSTVLSSPFLSAYEWQKVLEADNKQLNLSVEECQSIVRRLQLTPFEATRKVMIIWLPEYLRETGNILLKILEEPPQNTIILLVTNNESAILQTILSRTQLVRFTRPTFQECAQMLMQTYALSEEEAQRVSLMSDRNLVEAKSLVQNETQWISDFTLRLLRLCLKPNFIHITEITDEFADLGRENQKYCCSYLMHFTRECVLSANGAKSQLALQSSEIEAAKYFQKHLRIDQWIQFSHLFEQAYYHITRNANPKLCLRFVIMNAARIVKAQNPQLQLQ